MKISMKKYCGLILFAVICTFSCSKYDNDSVEYSDQYIEFGFPSIDFEGVTKGSVPVDALPEGSSFGVFGYCLAQKAPNDPTEVEASGALPWENKKNLIKPKLFYQKEVVYSGTGCSYENPVPWFKPADYLYSFFAYYPYFPGSGFSMLTNQNTFGAPRIKFSMPVGAAADSEDYNYNLDQHEIPDAMVSQEIDVLRGNGLVPMQFYHILAGLNFQVNNYNKDPLDPSQGKNLTVRSLKLKGTFYKSIVINFDKGYDYPSDETYMGTYTIVNSDVEVPAGTSVVEIGKRTLLLVSNISETGKENGYFGNVSLEIHYTFGGNEKTQTFTRPENFMPAGGTIYTAQLNFIGNAFVLNFVVDNNYNWENGGDSDIVFE